MSKQYKQTALDALRGNWPTAILTSFVAALFGATTITSGGSSVFEIKDYVSQEELDAFFTSDTWLGLLHIVIPLVVFAVLFAIAVLIIGGAMRLGYASYKMNLLDGKPAVFHDLFSHMNCKWRGFCMNFFIGLYTLLWSLLFVIPGTVKSFAYAMTPYILAENPEMSANDAISESQYMMTGHKWELFCLHLSFIGWGILVNLPAIIVILIALFNEPTVPELFNAILIAIPLSAGNLFLRPYIETAHAAFYRSISPKKPEDETIWYQPQ